jgi:hypothetical protein
MTVPFCLFNQCSTSVRSLSLILDLTDEVSIIDPTIICLMSPPSSGWCQSIILLSELQNLIFLYSPIQKYFVFMKTKINIIKF